jgi:putative ABC transport system permease protein
MALGARAADVLGLVMKQGLGLVLIGVVIGLAGSLGLMRFLAALLYGIRPGDPVTLAVVAVGMIGVALLACYIPARRATRVDPMVALRYE